MMLERAVTYIYNKYLKRFQCEQKVQQQRAIFRSFLLSGGSVRGDFGMHRHDVTECLPSKALKYVTVSFL